MSYGTTGDLAGVAERLRVVKNAQRRFMLMWDIEQAVVGPLLDRLAADVAGTTAGEGVDSFRRVDDEG